GEDVLGAAVGGHPLQQVGSDRGDIVVDLVVDRGAFDDQRGDVLVEHVAHHLDGEVRLPGEGGRRGVGLVRLLDLLPLRAQALDVAGQLLLAGSFGAVRTITPASSGMIWRMIFFSRARSVSGSLREIPVIDPPGTNTR